MRWIDKPGDVAERGVFLTADYADLRRFFSPQITRSYADFFHRRLRGFTQIFFCRGDRITHYPPNPACGVTLLFTFIHEGQCLNHVTHYTTTRSPSP
jgi:hypothetical protein